MKATKVKNAYMKKKDPLFVRESLLNAASELAATKGMADVTVNKVSELADVTKGAFFHHFDSKETLVTELMQMLLTRLDKQFDLMIEGKGLDELKKYRSELISRGIAAGEIPDEKVFGHYLFSIKDPDGNGITNYTSQAIG